MGASARRRRIPARHAVRATAARSTGEEASLGQRTSGCSLWLRRNTDAGAAVCPVCAATAAVLRPSPTIGRAEQTAPSYGGWFPCRVGIRRSYFGLARSEHDASGKDDVALILG